MDDLNDQLGQWIQAAYQHSGGSPERRKLITRIISTMQRSGRIWRGHPDDHPYYEDALQKTWIWFTKNLCNFNPDQGTVLGWFNNALKYRLKDEQIRWFQEQKSIEPPYKGPDGEWREPIDRIPGVPEPEPILDAVLEWLEINRKELYGKYLRDRPKVNCYNLILHRLPLPESYMQWSALSDKYGVGMGSLSSFYQDKCMKQLRKFGQSQGYFDDL
jgi:hypothetical protein